jgi:hypothetical protein
MVSDYLQWETHLIFLLAYSRNFILHWAQISVQDPDLHQIESEFFFFVRSASLNMALAVCTVVFQPRSQIGSRVISKSIKSDNTDFTRMDAMLCGL